MTTLQNNCFEEQQLWGAAFRGSFTDNFGEQLSVATLGRSFGRFEESELWGNSFGDHLWGTALGSSFGQVSGPAWRQLREAALEFALFGAFFGTRLFGNNFEEQLWGVTAGSNFAALQQH